MIELVPYQPPAQESNLLTELETARLAAVNAEHRILTRAHELREEAARVVDEAGKKAAALILEADALEEALKPADAPAPAAPAKPPRKPTAKAVDEWLVRNGETAAKAEPSVIAHALDLNPSSVASYLRKLRSKAA